jgi:hypothetical protein
LHGVLRTDPAQATGRSFQISCGSKTEAVVVVAELTDGTDRDRGESVPCPRYGETPDGIVAAIDTISGVVTRP